MKVSFTGIDNLKILRKQYNIDDSKKDPNPHMILGDRYYSEIIISGNLTDKSGNHLSDYKSKVPKSFINHNEPDKFELHMKRYDIPKLDLHHSAFKFNGKNLLFDSDEKLSLFTFLARLTRDGAKDPNFSENQHKVMNFVNQSIHKEVSEYMDDQVSSFYSVL